MKLVKDERLEAVLILPDVDTNLIQELAKYWLVVIEEHESGIKMMLYLKL